LTDYISKVIRADKKFDQFRVKIEKDLQSRKIFAEVFDDATLFTLYSLSKKFFEVLRGCISSGKEANIFYAQDHDKNEVIVKIYRITTSNFRRMGRYLSADPRFTHIRKNRRQVVYSWVQREYKNLLNATEAGCKSPKPIAFKNNVLIMEFIGSVGTPAPKLKNASIDNLEEVYQDIADNMKRLYQHNLVHADLSEYNILFYKKCVFIDFSQSTMTNFENSNDFLRRDVENIIHFFRKQGLTNVTSDSLMSYVVGDD